MKLTFSLAHIWTALFYQEQIHIRRTADHTWQLSCSLGTLLQYMYNVHTDRSSVLRAYQVLCLYYISFLQMYIFWSLGNHRGNLFLIAVLFSSASLHSSL